MCCCRFMWCWMCVLNGLVIVCVICMSLSCCMNLLSLVNLCLVCVVVVS